MLIQVRKQFIEGPEQQALILGFEAHAVLLFTPTEAGQDQQRLELAGLCHDVEGFSVLPHELGAFHDSADLFDTLEAHIVEGQPDVHVETLFPRRERFGVHP